MVDLKTNPFDRLRTSLESVRERIAGACARVGRKFEEVTLVAVTKNVPPALISEAFELGIRNFGENRVQEAEAKLSFPLNANGFPSGSGMRLLDIEPRPTWHLVGHLQSNKVKTALEFFDVIHSVDSVKLAEALSRRAQKKTMVLLQVNVAGEASKSGFSPEEFEKAYEDISCLPGIEVRGLMTIAPIGEAEEVRSVFRKLRELRDELCLKELSMGMSDDFEVAIEEGATMVRIGRAIFGERG